MHTPTFLDYQRQLIIASLDDFTPNDTLVNFRGGQYGTDVKSWMAAVVDFLCAAVACGLIEVSHRPEISGKRDAGLLRTLLEQGDSERDIPRDVLWDVMYFNGTIVLVDIMTQFGLHSWDAVVCAERRELLMTLRKICGGFRWGYCQGG